MNVSELSLRDLEYLAAIARELHFGNAAKELNVSQPTLSEQVRKLEDKLQIKIFERTNRSVHLTAIGIKLIEQAKIILNEAQKFINIVQDRTEPLCGEFHLGVIATIGTSLLPYIIGPLKKAYPNLELVIHEGLTDDLLRRLDAGELNAIIASRTFSDNNYRLYSLYFEPFMLATPKGFSIINSNKTVSLKNIPKDDLILLTDGNCFKDEVLNYCRLSRGHNKKIQASSLETLQHLVATGNGPSFIPKLSITQNKKLRNLITYYELAEKSAQREIVLVAREQYFKPEEIRLLVALLRQNAPL
jgi:LysR family hydrogen peroxide-inducible transcriptional activator